MSENTYQHAVVIGSSIAGLVTATILTRHFERVTIIERDRLSENARFRKGTPQATQPHILLKGGQMILEQLFPGLTAELEAADAPVINMGADLRWFVFGTWRPRYESSIQILGTSRYLLESTIRRRLAAYPQITFLQDATVTGLETDAERTRATGVKVSIRQQGETIVSGDLVVDVSGRGTHAPQWLEALGYTAPEKTSVNAFAGYSSRFYEVDPSADWKGMYVQPTPLTGNRGAVLLPQEGNRWHAALIGIAGDYPPNDDAGFLDFARSLPTPEVYEMLRNAKPLNAAVGFRHSENRMYHYESLPRWLENFVALGDAVFALNPVYGQGMTVASVSALDLDRTISEQRASSPNLTGLAERFQKALSATLAMPWQLATGEDMRWQGTVVEGFIPAPDPSMIEMGAYIDKVFMAALHNPAVLEVVYKVQNMIETPAAFFAPDIMAMVMADTATA